MSREFLLLRIKFGKAHLAFLFWAVSSWSFGQSLPDSTGLEAFMDGVINTHLRDKHLAGATVSIVKDGRVLLAKGYGKSDIKKDVNVTGDSTLFRVGSISKTFIWISVMQLVKEGKIDLDADVNQYLKDFKIPETYPQPVTMTHLMTHTAGFEDIIIGLFGQDSTSLNPLGTILARELPDRVRPPGITSSYSNHGATIAAYIVEQVSGMKFNDYVENRILNPLQMHTTTFRQPLPTYLRPMMSKGYKVENDELVEQPFEYVTLYPAGSASATATDMAHYMGMILNNGRYNGIQIIDSSSLSQMTLPAHQHHKDVNPMLHGFIDMSRNGVRVYGHGGDTFWFHSMMALFPEAKTGLFVSFNTEKGPAAAVMEAFMDRYFPRKELQHPIRMSNRMLRRFEGSYRVNRFAHRDLTKVGSLFGDVTISVRDSSALRLTGFGNVRYFLPVDSLTFREEHSSDVIAFGKDPNGVINQLFIGELPIVALDRTTTVSSAALHSSIFIGTAMLTIIMLFYWPVTSRARRGYEPMGSIVPLPPGAKVIGWLNYFLLGVFYIGLLQILSDPTQIVFGVPFSLKVLLVIPFIVILTTFIMMLQLYRIWNQRRHRLWSRVFYFLITIMSIAALWQLYYWNFIGFRY